MPRPWARRSAGRAAGNAFVPLVRRGRARTCARSRWCRSARPRTFGAARARQRGPAALLSRDGHALPSAHRRAHERTALALRDARPWRSPTRALAATTSHALAARAAAVAGHAAQLRARDRCAARPCRTSARSPSWSRRSIRRFVATLHGKGLSPRSLALHALGLARLLSLARARTASYAANPVLGVRAPKAAKPLPKALSLDEAQQLLVAPTDDSARGDPRPRDVRAALFVRPAPGAS